MKSIREYDDKIRQCRELLKMRPSSALRDQLYKEINDLETARLRAIDRENIKSYQKAPTSSHRAPTAAQWEIILNAVDNSTLNGLEITRQAICSYREATGDRESCINDIRAEIRRAYEEAQG